MQKNKFKSIAAVLLAVMMLLSVLPVGAAGLAEEAEDIVCYALTQEGKTGSDYASSDGISFNWCVWFTTYCASKVGLCGTTSDYTSNVFPPVERSTWEANNWGATGVPYQVNWFTGNEKGDYYYFGSRGSSVNSNSHTIKASRDSFVPEEGDLIYFDWEHDNALNHVAIVYDYDASTRTVYYIGGNQGSGDESWPERTVSKKTISMDSEDLMGFLKPGYQFSSDGNITIASYTTGDTYPDYLKNAAIDSIVDPWNFYNRECTSFAAWCLNDRNGVAFTNQYLGASRWGHAKEWGSKAQELGVTVDNNPAVGSIAWWTAGTYGHVAWVKEVSGSSVVIEEYNYNYAGSWGQRTIAASSPNGYIHIKDIPTVPQPSKPQILNAATNIDTWFEWTPCTNTLSYDVRVYNNGSSTPIVAQYGVTATYFTCHLNNGTYQFDVCATNNVNGEVVYTASDKITFTVTNHTEFEPYRTEAWNGHTYKLYDYDFVSWVEAKTFCEQNGGHLVTISDQAENDFVWNLIQNSSRVGCWTGGRTSNHSSWSWITGESFGYSNWASDEPNNSYGIEFYTQMWRSSGKWNDAMMVDTEICLVLEMDELEHSHSIEYVPEVLPTCTEPGNIAYWYCTGCGTAFSDPEGENEISIDDTVIPATGHTFVDEDIPATCISYAGIRHTCSVCGYSYVEYAGEYSDWSTEYPDGIDEALIESRTEYRYRDYETTTSYETSMEGWTQIGSSWVQSGSGTINYVSGWPSGYDRSHSTYTTYNKTPKTASETETDKVVINSTSTPGYIYWHWCRGELTDGPSNRLIEEYYTDEFCCFHAFYSTTPETSLEHLSSDYSVVKFANADSCTDSYWYWFLPVYRQNWTSYKKLFTYERWSDWSEWGPDPVEASDTREVETRTVYRYVSAQYGDHAWDEGVVTTPCTHEHDGEMKYTCTVCGATRFETILSPATYSATYFIDGEQYAEQLYWEDEPITPPDYTAPEGYTFSGWMLSDGSALPEVMPAHDLEVFGTLTRNYVTVTYTGAYTGTAEVPYGGNAELPVLDAEGVHFTFSVNGEPWDGTNLTEDVTVTVGMDINVYTVSFIDPVDGLTLSVQSVVHGQNAAAPEAPQHYGYTFVGWDTAFTNVKSDLTVIAIYDPVEFTVIFMDGCDNVIEVQSVPYLSAATAPADPVREGWTFTGWDVDFSCVEHALIVNATWSRNYYTVTFVGVYSGTVTVEHGADCELPVYDSASVHYTFTVNGEPWDGKNITCDVTVTVGVAINGVYTVTFVDWDGTVIDTQQVAYGAAAVAPSDPVRPGWTFIGWDREFSYVTGDLTVCALYEENEAPEVILGDVNGDGLITATDISVLFAYVMNAGSISDSAMIAADVNGDGEVNATDASLLAQMVFGA